MCVFNVLYLCQRDRQDAGQLDGRHHVESIDSDGCGVSVLRGYVEKLRAQPAQLWLLACTHTHTDTVTDTDIDGPGVPVPQMMMAVHCDHCIVDDCVEMTESTAPPALTDDGLVSRYVQTVSAKPLQYWLFDSGNVQLLNTTDAFTGSDTGIVGPVQPRPSANPSSVDPTSHIEKVHSHTGLGPEQPRPSSVDPTSHIEKVHSHTGLGPVQPNCNPSSVDVVSSYIEKVLSQADSDWLLRDI